MKPVILGFLGLKESFVGDRWNSELSTTTKKPTLLYIERLAQTRNSRYDSEEFVDTLEKMLKNNVHFQRLKESDWSIPHTKERLRELIKKVQSADIIMGRYGAGMHNALYASQGAIVFQLKT